jgi:hypothetical protein
MTACGEWGHRTFTRWFDALEWVGERVPSAVMWALTPFTMVVTVVLWVVCIIGANLVDWMLTK